MKKEFVPVKFPEDESAHDSIIEWWYFNGHLKDALDNEYSFMNCLFKVDVKRVKIPFLSKIPLTTSYFSHSLISDIKNKSFYHRITPFSIVSDDSFSGSLLRVDYINPEIKKGYTSCVIERTGELSYHMKNEDADLKFISAKTPLLEGGEGFIDLHPKTTYYYSLTNLKTKGRIKIENNWIDVTGKSWMDHQWADVSYSMDKWNWFSVQLDNNIEIVCCEYDDGKTKTRFADISYVNGNQEHYKEVSLIPSGKHWISPKSKAIYPLVWDIKIPEKNVVLNLIAKIDNQEMLFGSINYWEGSLEVTGTFGNKRIKGVGFMELVGYPSQYGNIRYIRDEIGRTANRFMSMMKNKAMDLSNKFKKRISG